MQCHLVTRFGENYTCDKRCIGFARRKICAHTVGASIYCGHLKEFLSYYTKNVFQEVTVTELTNTNAQAGKKFGAQRKRKSYSSDILTSKVSKPTPMTLGDAILEEHSPGESEWETTVETSTKLLLKKKSTKKPRYQETVDTPFELIKISGNIKVCAGRCRVPIRVTPGTLDQSDEDKVYCIRHKERDYFWNEKDSYRQFDSFADSVTLFRRGSSGQSVRSAVRSNSTNPKKPWWSRAKFCL